MHIIVLIKQVPDIKKVKMDSKTGTIIRKGVDSIINPLDLYAIESALQLKEQYPDTKITVMSMGTLSAEKELKEAIAMGCDEGILLTDKAFAGSDTWATSYILAKAIENIKPYDLIICGERAIDGDTSQVGPEIASQLKIPVISYVSKLLFHQNYLHITRRIEDGVEELSLSTPALLTVIKEINIPRLPTYTGKKKAKAASIKQLNGSYLKIPKENVGIKGSPTKVVQIFTPNVKRDCNIITVNTDCDMNIAQNAFCKYLKENNLI